MVRDPKAIKAGNISGAIKGTFKTDSIYNVTGDLIVNQGDTIRFEPGTKVYFAGLYNIFVHGNLSAIGTKASPVYIGVQGITKTDNPSQNPLTDPAYQGKWGGILGDSLTSFMIFKYCRIEYAGGPITSAQTKGTKNGGLPPTIKFINANGILDVEDSWFYGCVDGGAVISIKYGIFNVMRNIFEKAGIYGSECVELGAACKGNVAYNLMMGACTNGIKVSSGGTLAQDQVAIYNNTILNGGFRRYDYGGAAGAAGNSGGRGGSISLEQNGAGQIYNNLLVNNRIGLRIVGTGVYQGNSLVIADTAHCFYGNNYSYADSAVTAIQIYPQGFLTKPRTTDIPLPSSFLPSGYVLGGVYPTSTLIGANNPKFVNYPLPINLTGGAYSTLDKLAYVTGFDFHLSSTSPCIGKGNTSFTIVSTSIPISANFGATAFTPPGADIGCYQSNGSGLTN